MLTRLERREQKLAASIYIEGKGIPVLRRLLGVSEGFMEEIFDRLHHHVALGLKEGRCVA